MTSFDGAFERVIDHEGDHVDHPDDPGGETRFGISQRSYPELNIATLTLADAKEIYRSDYWDRVKADQLPAELRFILFDSAVNSGVSQSIKWLQQSLANITVDGVIGPKTLRAVEDSNPDKIARVFLGLRLRYMTEVRHWKSFGRGWARRVADNLITT